MEKTSRDDIEKEHHTQQKWSPNEGSSTSFCVDLANDQAASTTIKFSSWNLNPDQHPKLSVRLCICIFDSKQIVVTQISVQTL